MAVMRCIGAALVLALLAGCSLGDKQRQADAIVNAAKAAFAAGTATGTLSTSMRFVRLPDGAAGFLGAAGAAATTTTVKGSKAAAPSPLQQLAQAQQQQMERTFDVSVTLDLARVQAAVSLPRHDQPFAIYDGLVSYGRRWSAGPRDARPWVHVDGFDINKSDKIDPTQDAPTFFAFAINPVLLVDLIAGPLSGSVKNLGTETIGAVQTTHYRANFDLEKVLKHTRRHDFPEKKRKAVEDVLKVLAVSGNIHPGEVWLDADGRPRQFTLRLKEEPIRHFVIEHTITLRLDDFGAPSTLVLPTARERIDVRSVVQYIRATIPSPQAPEFLTFLGVAPVATAPTGASTSTTAVAP